MAKRIVVWTKTADHQFLDILEYWVHRNKSTSYSEQLIAQVSERTELIAEHPFSCVETDFKDIRMASMGNFSIYYKVTDTEIIVFAFWDNRQDPKKVLKLLESNS